MNNSPNKNTASKLKLKSVNQLLTCFYLTTEGFYRKFRIKLQNSFALCSCVRPIISLLFLPFSRSEPYQKSCSFTTLEGDHKI